MSRPAGPHARPRPGAAALGLLALGLATGLATAACAGNPATSPAPATAAAPTTFSALPAGPCGDDQAGRYTSEIFDVAPVRTVTYSGALAADLYTPANDPATCRVGVVWVHGGGFTQFTRDSPAEQAWGAALARRGYTVASIDYRLGTGEPFGLDDATTPERQAVVADAITDARAAVDWLRGSATDPGSAAGVDAGVDPGRVAIGGTSAGAMTALGAGLTAGHGDAADSRPPCGIVAIAGDLDPDWIAGRPPSVLFVHGDADQLVPYQSAVDGARLVEQAGGQAEVVTMSGAGHEITGEPDAELVATVSGWLRGHVAGGCD